MLLVGIPHFSILSCRPPSPHTLEQLDHSSETNHWPLEGEEDQSPLARWKETFSEYREDGRPLRINCKLSSKGPLDVRWLPSGSYLCDI